MPLPEPDKKESKENFISRCISWMEDEKDRFPNKRQRIAICYSQWKKHEKKIQNKEQYSLFECLLKQK